MELPKNQGRVVADFRGPGGVVCLVVYPDESWAILRDGETVLAWGPGETADCITAFVGMGGFDASVAAMGVPEGQPGVIYPLHDEHAAVAGDWRRGLLPRGDEYRFN